MGLQLHELESCELLEVNCNLRWNLWHVLVLISWQTCHNVEQLFRFQFGKIIAKTCYLAIQDLRTFRSGRDFLELLTAFPFGQTDHQRFGLADRVICFLMLVALLFFSLFWPFGFFSWLFILLNAWLFYFFHLLLWLSPSSYPFLCLLVFWFSLLFYFFCCINLLNQWW